MSTPRTEVRPPSISSMYPLDASIAFAGRPRLSRFMAVVVVRKQRALVLFGPRCLLSSIMVLTILDVVARSPYFPSNYLVHIVAAIASVLFVRALAQGRTTNRDRDLHARVIIMTVRPALCLLPTNN